MPYTILIADDHPFSIEGLQATLETIEGCEVVATVANGIAAIAAIKKHRPDCALLDLSMPGANGYEVFVEGKRWSPETTFAVVTGISSSPVYSKLFDAGIDGLFVKNSPPEEIAEGIRALMRGETVIAPLAQALIDEQKSAEQLSARELEVLYGLARGQTNRQLAERLGISPKTVDTHRTTLLRKMQATNTASLLMAAMRRGLLDL